MWLLCCYCCSVYLIGVVCRRCLFTVDWTEERAQQSGRATANSRENICTAAAGTAETTARCTTECSAKRAWCDAYPSAVSDALSAVYTAAAASCYTDSKILQCLHQTELTNVLATKCRQFSSFADWLERCNIIFNYCYFYNCFCYCYCFIFWLAFFQSCC